EQDGLRRQSSLSQRCVELISQEHLRRAFLRAQHALSRLKGSDPVSLPLEGSLGDMGSILSVLAFTGSGFEIGTTPAELKVRPAYHYSFSLWRFVHELRRPSGNKRQGASHWRSRDLQGTVRVPSSVTCELVETSVPGEALYIPEAGGWRPWLPLLCDVYRMIFRFPRLTVFTPDGVTTVERPSSWRQRLGAWTHLVWDFERISRLRNWTTRQGGDPAAYIQSLRQLGFTVRFESAATGEAEDVTLMKFFGRDS
ncbi:MAG: hypothetical protein M3Q07_25955, partial [Pseudobdellovibrionaceae bacterium]|nr:hypothetical protein [Pseudobdellovibrionaceae bacterium]